jgi:N6-L-threonylcarbamoyladenine synthase
VGRKRDAFDKTAKLLQIPWLPGLGPGASLETYAHPHPTNTDLNTRVDALLAEIKPFKPSAAKQRAFSFAGLKTQVMKETQKRHPNLQLKGKLGISEVVKRAVGRRFQQAAVRQVEEKVRIVLDYLEKDSEGMKLLPEGEKVKALVASGGVASNQYLRTR